MKHIEQFNGWFDSLKCVAYFETKLCSVSGQNVSLDTSKAKGAAISQMTRLPPTLPPICLRMVYIVSVSPALIPSLSLFHTGTSAVGSGWVGGWEGMIGTHTFKQCTAAEHMWPHPGRAHERVCNFFICLRSLVSGRKQVYETSSQSVTIKI